MTRIANSRGARSYRSDLRTDQAEETRARILNAAIRVMAGGIASLSVPAVAREAHVSVPTVYRHFGTKGELLAALYPHVARTTGLDDPVYPRSLDDLRDGARRIFERLDSMGDLERAAMASPAAEEARRAILPDRTARIRRFADTIAPEAGEVERGRIARLLMILTSSSALRTWRDYLGASVEDAADDIDWVIRAAIAAASRRNDR